MFYEIRVQMLNHNVTFDDLARELNISRNTISKKVNGKNKFYLDEIMKIQEKFFPNITIDKLIARK